MLRCYISFHSTSRVPEILQYFAKSYHGEDIHSYTFLYFSLNNYVPEHLGENVCVGN